LIWDWISSSKEEAGGGRGAPAPPPRLLPLSLPARWLAGWLVVVVPLLLSGSLPVGLLLSCVGGLLLSLGFAGGPP
jgi:hypothetical protein